MPRNIVFTPSCFQEYIEWRSLDNKIVDRINALIKDISRDPFIGIGKPEALKGNYKGFWSRRITQEHRLVYRVDGENIHVVKCYGHYDD